MFGLTIFGVRFSVSLLFCLLFCVGIYLGYGWYLLLLIAGIAAHETAHILAGLLFKCRIVILKLTVFGFSAEFSGANILYGWKRAVFCLCGPAVNLLLALLFRQLGINLAVFINALLFAVNLFPISITDGGGVLFDILLRNRGISRACTDMYKLSRVIVWLMLAAGFAVCVLFPLNIGLVCIALYIKTASRDEMINARVHFHINHVLGRMKFGGKELPRRIVKVGGGSRVCDLAGRINLSHCLVFELSDGRQVSEPELLDRYLTEPTAEL